MTLSMHLRGEDVDSRSYWAWEWADRGDPRFVAIEHENIATPLAALDAALPGLLGEELDATRAEMLARIADDAVADRLRAGSTIPARLRTALMVSRCVSGALASREQEAELARLLGATLIPPGFVDALRARASENPGEEIEVRVLPAPSCTRVPWEILSTGGPGDERLIDVARVVTMAPVLSRDGDTARAHPSWEAHRTAPPLYVIDPQGERGAVLTADAHASWRDRIASERTGDDDIIGVVAEQRDRNWLSERLRRVQRSRLVYVGHVEANESTAGKTALILSDSARMYGLGTRVGDRRYLAAQDLFAGTQGSDAYFRHLSNTRGIPLMEALEREFGGVPEFPDVAVGPDGTHLSVSGAELWPIPPRAALVACQSGADLAHAEPFGLVTALLESGAELVAATRWVLLTDTAFRTSGGADLSPLNDMAILVDDVLRAADPFAALAAWQRGRLAAWRASGALEDSPLTWAALTLYHAPDRTSREPAGALSAASDR